MKKSIDISQATRLINSGAVIMVTSGQQEKDNIITLAWHMPVSKNPPIIAIALANSHYSTELIKENKEFVINVPNERLLPDVMFCGTKSGRDINKFAETGLTKEAASKVKTPWIAECIGHIECQVSQEQMAGDHIIFYGQVLASSVSDHLFDGTWLIEEEEVKLIHHLGGRDFYCTGNRCSIF